MMSSKSVSSFRSFIDSGVVGLLRRCVLFALLCGPMTAWSSSCGFVLTALGNKLYLEVWYGSNCDDTGSIVYTHKKNQNGEFDREDMFNHSVPFESECVFSDSGDGTRSTLLCRAEGRSPLAGAKYVLKQKGTYTLKCDELGDYPDTPLMQYQCVSGCSDKTPMVLDKEDPCD